VRTASTSRLASADSNRGDFWKVARAAFADEPLRGVGASGFRVEWLRERPIPYAARDAHSLYLETPAELGLVGLALLVAILGGIVACAVRARALDPTLAAGPIAVGGAWLVHAGLDWDWEMPGVTLPALVLAAVLVAHGERSPRPPDEVPRREERVPEPRPVGVEVGR
jgi:O-antigen ligase